MDNQRKPQAVIAPLAFPLGEVAAAGASVAAGALVRCVGAGAEVACGVGADEHAASSTALAAAAEAEATNCRLEKRGPGSRSSVMFAPLHVGLAVRYQRGRRGTTAPAPS